MPDITVLLTNYRRPQNLPVIFDALKRQTAKPRIFLWSNAKVSQSFGAGLDLVVRSSVNLLCWPRWLLGATSDTDIVMSLDDDYVLAHRRVLAAILECFQKIGSNQTIFGPEGVSLKKGMPYFPTYPGRMNRSEDNRRIKSSVHIRMPLRDQRVDIIKGRCLAVARTSLAALPLNPHLGEKCDDIAISSLVASRRKAHVVPAILSGGFKDLPEMNGPMALSSSSNWRTLREEAKRFYFDRDSKKAGRKR